jgi:hypothetical protein
VICVSNRGYPVSLEVDKVYRRLKSLATDPKSRIRVMDESGEDYLYPESFFREVEVSGALRRALSRSRAAPAA